MNHKNLKFYYSIGEVAAIIGVDKPTLRYWEQEFPDFITPHKRDGGVRQYTQADIDQIKKIFQLVKVKGMTLQGAAKLLRDNRAATDNRLEVLERLKAIREDLEQMRKELDENMPY